MRLSQADVVQLAQMPSPKARVNVAGKIAGAYAQGAFSGREKDVALEILQSLVKDAEAQVRAALGFHLRTAADLPRDIALRLAHDIEQVSLPMLEYSPVLRDQDLLAIIESSHEITKLVAIARRGVVAASVSDALLATYQPAVATALFANKGAYIKEHSMLRTIDIMARHESVMEAMMERGGLPLVCVERIFMSVSDAMKKRLAERFHVSRHLIEGRLEYAREMSTLGMAAHATDVDVQALVRLMKKQHKLTSSAVIRSLCVGDLRFFEHAMAELTGVPVENVRILMRDAGEGGFSGLYRLSPLPPAYYAAVRKLLDIVLESNHNGKENPREFSQRVIDNIVAKGYDSSINHMPLLLAIIKGNASEFPKIH